MTAKSNASAKEIERQLSQHNGADLELLATFLKSHPDVADPTRVLESLVKAATERGLQGVQHSSDVGRMLLELFAVTQFSAASFLVTQLRETLQVFLQLAGHHPPNSQVDGSPSGSGDLHRYLIDTPRKLRMRGVPRTAEDWERQAHKRLIRILRNYPDVLESLRKMDGSLDANIWCAICAAPIDVDHEGFHQGLVLGICLPNQITERTDTRKIEGILKNELTDWMQSRLPVGLKPSVEILHELKMTVPLPEVLTGHQSRRIRDRAERIFAWKAPQTSRGIRRWRRKLLLSILDAEEPIHIAVRLCQSVVESLNSSPGSKDQIQVTFSPETIQTVTKDLQPNRHDAKAEMTTSAKDDATADSTAAAKVEGAISLRLAKRSDSRLPDADQRASPTMTVST